METYLIVAKRIAQLYLVDPCAAEDEYQAQVSAMSEYEAAIFASTYIRFLIELKG